MAGTAGRASFAPWMWPVAVFRLTRVLLHIVQGLAVVYAVLPRLSEHERQRAVQAWSAQLLSAMGLRLQVQGTPRPGAKLVVANHISWLDIMAINAVVPSRFVSKAEVAHWPVVGRLVTAAGTLYLQRERRRDAMRVVGLMSQALANGDTVAVFPEGTTGTGHGVMPFHGNLMQSAIDAQVPVQPIALRYSDRYHLISQRAAYVGDTSLVQSLWWIVSSTELVVHVTILPPESVRHADRRALAQHLQDTVGRAIPG